jgi:hypothetical protein
MLTHNPATIWEARRAILERLYRQRLPGHQRRMRTAGHGFEPLAGRRSDRGAHRLDDQGTRPHPAPLPNCPTSTPREPTARQTIRVKASGCVGRRPLAEPDASQCAPGSPRSAARKCPSQGPRNWLHRQRCRFTEPPDQAPAHERPELIQVRHGDGARSQSHRGALQATRPG